MNQRSENVKPNDAEGTYGVIVVIQQLVPPPTPDTCACEIGRAHLALFEPAFGFAPPVLAEAEEIAAELVKSWGSVEIFESWNVPPWARTLGYGEEDADG